jgi:hypothetical protein
MVISFAVRRLRAIGLFETRQASSERGLGSIEPYSLRGECSPYIACRMSSRS